MGYDPETIPECKVVALTAFQNASVREKCANVGMVEVLNKPAHCNFVYRCITQYVINVDLWFAVPASDHSSA
jgi:CheY-like chemotaxis protein